MKKIYIMAFVGSAFLATACNDYLNVTPITQVAPESYFNNESQLKSYMMGCYSVFDPSKSYGFSADCGSDDQIGKDYNKIYTLDEYKVPTGSNWNFNRIYNINWFLEQVLPKYESGSISGSTENVRHYIGEAYFFRAWEYFYNVRTFGDFPIIKKTYDVDKPQLIEISKRLPRTEVVHFILEDLDRAIEMMSPNVRNNKNTLYRPVAQLIKSRVALYEASWLKYFKGTAFVPNGTDWPGATSNTGWNFPKGSIENEINWLYEQAMEAADAVASTIELTSNSGILPQAFGEANDYIEMFGAKDMSGYSEILLWKAYKYALGISNGNPQYAAGGNADQGLTRGLINSFLMEDGLPIYASSTEKPYQGDNSIVDVLANRENRMFLFVKQPGQINGYINTGTGNQGHEVEPYPEFTSSTFGYAYPTGYASRKGWNPDVSEWYNIQSSCGFPIFRASEAYLNYIEACYERNGQLDSKADVYWRALRRRAGVNENYMKTVNATDMTEEGKTDWAAYSAGILLTDPLLYNIRRERRCELMLEGLRFQDLYRWRAMDQMIEKPYHMEGFKIWNSDMTDWYDNLDYTSTTSPNVTPPSEGDYVRVWEIKKSANPIVTQNGCRWKMGHYLTPLGIDEFRKTSFQSEGYTDSPLYQNPYWSMTPEQPASK